jgi:alpha-beta hydrolase superfamily lysophospholipase
MKTTLRVILTIVAFVLFVNAVISFGPNASTARHWIGGAVLVLGVLSAWSAVHGRRFVALGAVGITVAAMVVVVGTGVAVATWPCSFPPVPVGGLSQDQLGDSSISTPPTGFVPATDGTKLAYFAYVPAKPIATLVFYHGSGAHSTAGYLGLGKQLAAKYGVATYLVDIRGHGSSGGPRGDAPSQQQVWDDTKSVVDFVRGKYPRLPEYVGGHSAGAGVVLNSESRIGSEVAGYAFLAPDFGLNSGTSQQAGASNFATVCTRAFVANAATQGLLDAHTDALGFAYTKEQIAGAGLINRYTVTMALAQNPSTSAAVLKDINKPIAVWIGSQDEVFNPAKVLAYAMKAQKGKSTVGEVPGRNHLGVLANGADYIGPWITAQVLPKS